MRKKTAIYVCLLVVCCLLLSATVVVAPKPPDKPGKPGGDDIPAGTLYFEYNDGSGNAVWTMKADGSDKTKLSVEPGYDFYYDSYTYNFGELSHLKHNEHFWFLRFEVIDGEFYPDGLPRREAFVVRDDNTIKVQMTYDPNLAPSQRDLGGYWAPDDEFTATVQYDGNGDITGASSPNLVWLTEITLDDDGYWRPRTGHNHDWSPDATAFCWQRGGIQVVDLIEGIETHISDGYTPRWSPDGNKIAFVNGGVRIINPDGSDEQLIVPAEDSRNIWRYTGNPRWSPDSLHISYNYREFNPSKMTSKTWICRVEASGGRVTKMTNDLPSEIFKKNVDWP
jgi:hypothetical protein